MAKEISFRLLKRIADNLSKIFEEEDEDYPDGRKISCYERAIKSNLRKLGADKAMEDDIIRTHCVLDQTYKEQCDRLRGLGYVITHDGEKGPRKP